MPRRKSKKKTIDQEDNYIPLDEDDVKHATEVPFKEVKDEDLVKIEKKGGGKRKVGKLKTRNIREELGSEEFGDEAVKRPTGKGGYILIVAEKPQAALKIAQALGSPRKYSEQKVPYYELTRENKKIVIAAAVGHLFTLTSTEKGFPIFKIKWKAEFKRNPWAKRYYSLLKKLAKNASEFILACDYDVEGEVIGWNVVRFIAGKDAEKKAKRMKFSTLTKPELEKAYDKPEKTINWGQAYAGETRHFLDWMYGINLSRALMSAIKSTGRFKILSIGRVQGPALNLIVKKELEIQKFKPKPYWQVFIKLKKHKPLLKYEKDLKKKSDLKKFKDLKDKEGQATTEKKSRTLQPPYPFDLTSLQREAYRLLRINPSRTLQLAQSLYLAGIISYPRTSSQKIPPEIQPLKILKKLSFQFKEVSLATRKRPIEGRKSDPAHPSIYSTGETGTMSSEEQKLYNLIAKRFISCFCEDALIENKKITFITDKTKLKFLAKGLEVKEKSWMKVYPAMIKEQEIEDINGKAEIEKLNIEGKQTLPPRRYTPASIITELEKKSIGTKATRSQIIETLYNRNYIKEQAIQATPLGINLISSLEKYSPIIIDEKLTRHFEREMEAIQKAKKNITNLQDQILKEAKKTIITITDTLKKDEEKIGKELVKATDEHYKQEREDNTVGECPVCKKGQLRIIYNRKFKRSFIGCSNYPKCKTTFSLPPGMIKILKDKEGNLQLCEHCKFPKLMRLMKGKRPWIFCFNPSCPSNEQWFNNSKNKKNYKSKKSPSS